MNPESDDGGSEKDDRLDRIMARIEKAIKDDSERLIREAYLIYTTKCMPGAGFHPEEENIYGQMVKRGDDNWVLELRRSEIDSESRPVRRLAVFSIGLAPNEPGPKLRPVVVLEWYIDNPYDPTCDFAWARVLRDAEIPLISQEEPEEDEELDEDEEIELPTAKSVGIKKGDIVTHKELGDCTVLKISKDGYKLKLQDEDGNRHKGIYVSELVKANEDENASSPETNLNELSETGTERTDLDTDDSDIEDSDEKEQHR